MDVIDKLNHIPSKQIPSYHTTLNGAREPDENSSPLQNYNNHSGRHDTELRRESPSSRRSPLGTDPLNVFANHKSFETNNDNSQAAQGRSIFSHENFVYGNPKEVIKTIEPKQEMIPEIQSFNNDPNVLDLSCKMTKSVSETSTNHHETYHSCKRLHKSISPFAMNPSLDISLVNSHNRKPSVPEQLQIAKIQRQQRKVAQQQQKMLQQMRRSMEMPGKSSNDLGRKPSGSSDTNHINQKTPKHYFSNEPSAVTDNQNRKKDERLQFPSSSLFAPPHYPYYDPGPSKELPDGHPILPLFDPVYFSALYNAHGYLPPSSPTIAAAFISTLHEILPKLPNVFPPTSNNTTRQKTNDQPN